MHISNTSPYEILNLPQDASSKDIKLRYRNLVRQFPPEHHPDEFMKYRAAYDELISTNMDAREYFPVYSKPLDFFSTEVQNQASTDRKHLLAEIFETPLDTDSELEDLITEIK